MTGNRLNLETEAALNNFVVSETETHKTAGPGCGRACGEPVAPGRTSSH